ncbi:hypothetical protein [Streptomyces umbrinus]|uniref:hypothetical protein n=1 Tax=Streptomyces umbrinus TaxID=67370 RepID=UPI00343DE4E6
MPEGSGFGDFDAEEFQDDVGLLRSAAYAGVRCVDRGDLLCGEVEVEDVEVLGDAGGLTSRSLPYAAAVSSQLPFARRSVSREYHFR